MNTCTSIFLITIHIYIYLDMCIWDVGVGWCLSSKASHDWNFPKKAIHSPVAMAVSFLAWKSEASTLIAWLNRVFFFETPCFFFQRCFEIIFKISSQKNHATINSLYWGLMIIGLIPTCLDLLHIISLDELQEQGWCFKKPSGTGGVWYLGFATLTTFTFQQIRLPRGVCFCTVHRFC